MKESRLTSFLIIELWLCSSGNACSPRDWSPLIQARYGNLLPLYQWSIVCVQPERGWKRRSVGTSWRVFLSDKIETHKERVPFPQPTFLPFCSGWCIMKMWYFAVRQPACNHEEKYKLTHWGWQSYRWKEPGLLYALINTIKQPGTSTSRLLEMWDN